MRELLEQFLKVQTDYVDAISEDIKKIGELQVKERREQHKKNIFDRLSGKIDKEVPAPVH